MNDADFIAAMQRGIPPLAPPVDPNPSGARQRELDQQRAGDRAEGAP